MKTIWKFSLSPEVNTLNIPAGAQLLSVKVQYGIPTLWALCDDNAHTVNRMIATIGTGHDATVVEGGKFVDTFLLNGGTLVFHVFDLGEK